MKVKDYLVKFFSGFIIILTVVASAPITAQQSMNLGCLQFVMPTKTTIRANRTIHMKMASTGISARFVNNVGGVSFIQTAEPEFKINSLSLGIDYDKNNAFTIINDTVYSIPLEVWELQSIVNFADQEDNAAVTLFGDNNARIKFHDAFLDNLMGLRILQTDLLLTSFLRPTDRGKLPAYSNGEFIMSPNEAERYNLLCRLDSIIYGASYEEISLYYTFQIANALDSIGDFSDTYIFTDYDQPIKFNHSYEEIVFDGRPYYRFIQRDSVLVDTLEMYYELKNFINTFNYQRTKYKDLSVSKVFKKTNNPVIYDLEKLTRKNKNIQKKAERAFELTNYYALCDTFKINHDHILVNSIIPELLQHYASTFSDSIVRHGSGNPELDNLCAEFMAIKDSLNHYDYPIVTAYVDMIYGMVPTDSTAMFMYRISKEFNLTYDKLLIEYMYDHKIPTAKTLVNSTNFLREHHTYTYMLNPIVIDAAEKVCQWSAFFRYVKENYYAEWLAFVNNVKQLKYDAPPVQTPIDFFIEDQ